MVSQDLLKRESVDLAKKELEALFKKQSTEIEELKGK